jgi:molecular chaperone HscA
MKMKETAETYLGSNVKEAIVTVPAYFNDAQRQATRDAGKLAGLDVLRIVNEPTAASLAYGIGLNTNSESNPQTIAVYDLGGGTFDISILRIINGIVDVLSTNGDTYLGGDDFDKVIIDFWKRENNISDDTLHLDKSLYQSIRLKAEEAKKHLSSNELFETNLNQYQLRISKHEFDQLIEPLIERTIACSKNALKDAKLTQKDITTVVMVGGSTRIPLVKNKIGDFFNQTVNDSVNPDEVVALGAAIQADILAGNNNDLLLLYFYFLKFQ